MELCFERSVLIRVLGKRMSLPSGYREILKFGCWAGHPEEIAAELEQKKRNDSPLSHQTGQAAEGMPSAVRFVRRDEKEDNNESR